MWAAHTAGDHARLFGGSSFFSWKKIWYSFSGIHVYIVEKAIVFRYMYLQYPVLQLAYKVAFLDTRVETGRRDVGMTDPFNS